MPHHLTRCSHTPNDAFIILLCLQAEVSADRSPWERQECGNSGYRPSALFIHTLVALATRRLPLLLLLTDGASSSSSSFDLLDVWQPTQRVHYRHLPNWSVVYGYMGVISPPPTSPPRTQTPKIAGRNREGKRKHG